MAKSFSRKEYNQYKKFLKELFTHVPWCAKVDNPIDWIENFLPLFRDSIADENHEAAQAFKDAVRELMNEWVGKEIIGIDDLLKIPTD